MSVAKLIKQSVKDDMLVEPLVSFCSMGKIERIRHAWVIPDILCLTAHLLKSDVSG